MKILKIVYYTFGVFVVVVTLLLIGSALPIPGNYKIFSVRSGSMVPAIKQGSVIIVKPVSKYKVGDVITYGAWGKTKDPITHRIYDIKITEGEPVYIVKGDANDDPDPRGVAQEGIIGKVFFSVPYIGYVLVAVQKPIGFAVIIIVPALAIMYDEVRKILKEVKKNKELKSQ